MSSLQTFHQRVARAIKRGNVFDADIPGHGKDAVRTLEDLHDWRHMWVEDFSQTLIAGIGTISLDRVKNVRYIRFYVDGASVYRYLKKVSADQIAYIEDSGAPVGFWMMDQNTVGLDAKPSETMTYDIGYYQYSEYDSDLPWLDIAENMLVAQTVIEMAPLLKDDKTKARFESYVNSRTQILVEAGSVHEFDGQEQRMIPYGDEMDDWMVTGASTD